MVVQWKMGPSNSSFLSFGVVFHWTMIMGERVITQLSTLAENDPTGPLTHQTHLWVNSIDEFWWTKNHLPKLNEWFTWSPWSHFSKFGENLLFLLKADFQVNPPLNFRVVYQASSVRPLRGSFMSPIEVSFFLKTTFKACSNEGFHPPVVCDV